MNERIIEIDYTNHRGERRTRKIIPTGQLVFSSNQWHPQPQWLFNAIDLDHAHDTVKTFALAGLHGADDDRRVTELLANNNELLERARKAEAELEAFRAERHQLLSSKEDILNREIALADQLKTANAEIEALKKALAADQSI